jgi:hypothetical protein
MAFAACASRPICAAGDNGHSSQESIERATTQEGRAGAHSVARGSHHLLCSFHGRTGAQRRLLRQQGVACAPVKPDVCGILLPQQHRTPCVQRPGEEAAIPIAAPPPRQRSAICWSCNHRHASAAWRSGTAYALVVPHHQTSCLRLDHRPARCYMFWVCTISEQTPLQLLSALQTCCGGTPRHLRDLHRKTIFSTFDNHYGKRKAMCIPPRHSHCSRLIPAHRLQTA